MAYSHCERLSATDALFLDLEDPAVHMHVGAVAVFDGAPLRSDESGAIELERLEAFVSGVLHESPRFRQKLAWQPVTGHPFWVDDERFNIHYHVRHTALPPPGNERQLKRLAGRVISQKLDRGKPLWEMWLVEGLEEGRVAMILKAHHCMVDGIAGFDLLARMMRLEPDPSLPAQQTWVPRPAPSSGQLLAEELWRRSRLPLSLLAAGREAAGRPRATLEAFYEGAASIAETVGAGLAPTASTPLNPTIGPYRRFDWLRTDLASLREVRKRHGGTLNDVVLSIVAGAVGGFLRRRGEDPAAGEIRAMVPVSIRSAAERGREGNRVINFLCPLPVAETDPVRRLEHVAQSTRELKRSRVRRGAELVEEIGDATFKELIGGYVRLAASRHAFNLVVTNVPGPPVPAYLLGARMREIYPVVPLFTDQALGIALFSYDGWLHWGFDADWDAMPDLHEVVEDVRRETEQLLAADLPDQPLGTSRRARGVRRPARRDAAPARG